MSSTERELSGNIGAEIFCGLVLNATPFNKSIDEIISSPSPSF